MQTLLGAVNVLIGYVQAHSRRVLLVIDGLDRITDVEQATSLFLDSELIAQLACPLVVCGPFALSVHPAASAVPRFGKHCMLVNESVMQRSDPRAHGPGVDFFCDLYQRRVADLSVPDIVPNTLLKALAYYSGGRARDFVRFIQTLAEQAWIFDSERATEALITKVLEDARLRLETGLDVGHIKVLEAVANDPQHRLPADDRARELLNYGHLLPYMDESIWYYPHTLLTIHMLRTNLPGSHD
jgi:hypothetical protein